MLIVLSVAFSACHKDKEYVEEQIRDYELYIIDALGDSAVVRGFYDEDEKIAGLNVYIESDDEDVIVSVVEKAICASDTFLQENPDYILNEGYTVNINFAEETNDNGSPGLDICQVSTHDKHDNTIGNQITFIHVYHEPFIETMIDRFDEMEYINCYSYSQDQISKVAETYSNAKVIYVQTKEMAESFNNVYPGILFVGIRD